MLFKKCSLCSRSGVSRSENNDMMDVKEKSHRLPKDFYIGKISVAFTLCLKGDVRAFIKNEIISIF